MTPQDIAQELGHAAAQELLTSAQLLRLAYNGLDGLPRVIPIGFHWDGEHIVVCTATTSPKARALSSRPEVAVTIDVGSTPSEAKALLVRGIAAVEIVDGVPGEYLAGARKTLDAEQVEAFERQVRSMYDRWPASRSSRDGLDSTTSEPAASRPFSRRWRAKPPRKPGVSCSAVALSFSSRSRFRARRQLRSGPARATRRAPIALRLSALAS